MTDTSHADPYEPVEPSLPAGQPVQEQTEQDLREQKRNQVIGIVIAVVVVILLILSLVFLLHPGLSTAETVERIRDVFIIVMAFESFLIGAVLVILIVQLARLTNLLQNEIKPILDSTNETVSTLRGTSKFISDNVAEPIIKLNEYVAALQKLVELLGLNGRRKI